MHRPKSSTRAFEPLERWATTELAQLLEPAVAEDVISASPVRRATAEGLARNTAIVLGNRGDRAALPALQAARETHPSAVVREAADWAASRLRT